MNDSTYSGAIWKNPGSKRQHFIPPQVILLTLPLHIFHIILIIKKRNLHQNVYYILLNLSLSDSCLAIMRGLPLSKKASSPSILKGLAMSFYVHSILLTLAINLDRYMKVKYGLRYHQMVTKKKLCALLLLLSITSIIIALIPSQIQNGQYLVVTLRSFALICSFLLIFASTWIKKVRDRAAEEIRKRNVYFGIQGEEFGILQRLKGAIRETIQLSFITATILIAGSLLTILNTALNLKRLWMTSSVFYQLYLLSNPFVYMFVMKDLRSHYVRYFTNVVRMCRPSNSVGIEPLASNAISPTVYCIFRRQENNSAP